MLTLERGENGREIQNEWRKKDPAASRAAPPAHVWSRRQVGTLCSVNGGRQSPSKDEPVITSEDVQAEGQTQVRASSRRVRPKKKRERLSAEVFERSGVFGGAQGERTSRYDSVRGAIDVPFKNALAS